MNEPFKTCSCCGTKWINQNDFISDREIEIIGYKADFEKLDYSKFFFNHKKQGCNSTITIHAVHFLNLYTGTKYTERKNGSKNCPGYCLKFDQLDRCNAFCECAFNREIIAIIKEKNS